MSLYLQANEILEDLEKLRTPGNQYCVNSVIQKLLDARQACEKEIKWAKERCNEEYEEDADERDHYIACAERTLGYVLSECRIKYQALAAKRLHDQNVIEEPITDKKETKKSKKEATLKLTIPYQLQNDKRISGLPVLLQKTNASDTTIVEIQKYFEEYVKSFKQAEGLQTTNYGKNGERTIDKSMVIIVQDQAKSKLTANLGPIFKRLQKKIPGGNRANYNHRHR
jgi:hypothetical protein